MTRVVAVFETDLDVIARRPGRRVLRKFSVRVGWDRYAWGGCGNPECCGPGAPGVWLERCGG